MPVLRRRAESKACSTRRFSPAGSGTRPGMPTKSGGDVPDHIREDLPEELSGLPTELIYAANLVDFELSKSEAVNRAAEAHGSLVRHLDDLYGPAWPPEADDAARETWVVFECAHQRMGEAMWWVRTMLVTTDSSSDEEQAKKQAKMRAKKQAKKQTKKQTKKQDEEADEEVRRMKKPLLRRRAKHGMAGWRWTNRVRKLAETTRRTTRCCERTPGALASSHGQPG